jgi:hypothetical protein
MTQTRTPSRERGCQGKANIGRRYQQQADRMAVRHGKLNNAHIYESLICVTGE